MNFLLGSFYLCAWLGGVIDFFRFVKKALTCIRNKKISRCLNCFLISMPLCVMLVFFVLDLCLLILCSMLFLSIVYWLLNHSLLNPMIVL